METYTKLTDALNDTYNEVVAYVKEHQGEKGYIDCQPYRDEHHLKDTIYAFMYNAEMGCGYEYYVYGVRVREGELEVLLEPINTTYRVKYQPEDFTTDNPDNQWECVRYDVIYYVPTLFNIAECIEEYV